MAVTNKWYGKAFKAAFNKEVDLDTDTIKVALVTSSYTFDQDAHDYFNDITNEVTGTGYTAGGATLGSVTVSYDGASNTLTFDAADVAWASSTITARGAVIYVSTGTSSTSALLLFVDFGADVSTTAGTFTIQWNASGIASVTVS
jgi:hypothetical protein